MSYSYHVLLGDWTGSASFEAYGETYDVQVARTPDGVFGRSPKLWHEARGDTLDEMLLNLRHAAEPLFQRRHAIAKTLGLSGQFEGQFGTLGPVELIKLLYCRDRDVANDARIRIETMASLKIFGPVLIEIIRDRRHPDRRGAQWCVLDLFEDIESFCGSPEERASAIYAIKDLLWDAEDDYARTIYKAGVVLGGHVPDALAAEVLMECLEAPSKIGRRAAIHGLFHVVEWHADKRARIMEALVRISRTDPEPAIRDYAAGMARDLQQQNFDHVAEPAFPDEYA